MSGMPTDICSNSASTRQPCARIWGLDSASARTCVHYIRGNRTIELSSEDCMAEFDRLESTIGKLEAHDD